MARSLALLPKSGKRKGSSGPARRGREAEMASRKRKHGNRKRSKRKQTSASIKSLNAAIRVARAAARNGAPRPRVKLPEAFRAFGLDEYAIAQFFAEQVSRMLEGKRSSIPGKLLLDWLKEAIRVIFPPARRGDIPEQPAKIELVHFVPRPDRSSGNSLAESSPSQLHQDPASNGAASSQPLPVFD